LLFKKKVDLSNCCKRKIPGAGKTFFGQKKLDISQVTQLFLDEKKIKVTCIAEITNCLDPQRLMPMMVGNIFSFQLAASY
jgi:hypothetical protein